VASTSRIACVISIMLALSSECWAQNYTPDEVAEKLGYLIALGSECSRPTAPFETEFATYLKRLQPGPLEADRLRNRMMNARHRYTGIGQFGGCGSVDKSIAQLIADLRAHGG
jgi:hypothetical protein